MEQHESSAFGNHGRDLIVGTSSMRRRDLLAAVGATAVSFSLIAHAEPSPHRIAVIASIDPVAEMHESSNRSILGRLFGELRRLGYVEGQNLIVDRFSAEGHTERHAEIAREAIAREPQVILVFNNVVTSIYKRATSSIPIVAMMGSAVESGLVANLAHPGGNITGVTVDAGPEYGGKRVELLKQTIPGASRVIFLGMAGDEQWPSMKAMRDAAVRQQIELIELRVPNATDDELRRAFDRIIRDRPDALHVSERGDFYGQRWLIVELAENVKIPAMYTSREWVELGGLMSFGSPYSQLVSRMVSQVDQILKGARPADIPVEQATKLELLINLKTAKRLGITIPPVILARADEVIE